MTGHTSDHPLSCAGRTLTNSSFHTYNQIPKNVDAQSPGDEVRLQVLNCSKSFREHLKATASDISKYAEALEEMQGEVGLQDSLEQDYDTVYSIEKSWQICEIFCLNPTKTISIELIRWLKELCYQVPLDSYLVQFQHADEPESLTASTVTVGYWDLVYQLVMQGNLVGTAAMLSWHSEISSALTANIDTIGHSSNAISKAQCAALFDLLRSHPFAGVVSVNDSTASVSLNASVVQEFTAWQNRLRKFRQSKVALLSVIPELDTVLRILLGDSSTLEHYCELPGGAAAAGWDAGWGWAKQAIALLLYVYPPPLNKGDLCRVIEECMRKETETGSSGDSLSKGYIATLREVMVGNIGPMLRSLYQMTLSDSPYRRHLGVVPLLCTAHLCILLVTGAAKEDLLIPLADGPNETSFFEEIFLEVAYKLHSLEFPAEVVLGYLSVCPMRGKEYARVLLPLSSMPSDRSVLSAAHAMRELLDLPQEAAAVLVARGRWWSKQGNAAKAAYFYQEAADEPRLAGLLEASLQRCMVAVVGCRTAFPGLAFTPSMRGAGDQEVAGAERTNEERMQELEAALVEAEELLQVVDSDTAAPQTILGLVLKSLGVYVQVVQDRFATSASSLRGAVQRLASLMIDSATGPVLPIRYWLHTLELVAWYANCISSLESAGSVDFSATASADDDMQVEAADTQEEALSTLKPTRRPVFRKDQAYALLVKLKEVTTSYGAARLIGHGKAAAVQNLHLGLMGILCSSTIKENALLGTQKASAGYATNKVGYNKRFAFEGAGARLNQGWLSASGRARESTSLETSLQRAEAYEILTGSSVDYQNL